MKKMLRHSLRFKLTMLLMVIMTLTIFGSVAVTFLSVKTYFVSRLEKRMINTYNEVNTIFTNRNLETDEIRDALSKIVAKGDMTVFIMDARDGTQYTNINEKSRMLESMQALANLLNSKDEDNLSDLFNGVTKGVRSARSLSSASALLNAVRLAEASHVRIEDTL